MQSVALAETDFAEQIRELHREAQAYGRHAYQDLCRAANAALEAGHLLTEQKALLPHGAWTAWHRANVGEISERTVQLYMQLWGEWSRLHPNPQRVADLAGGIPSIRQLLVEYGILRAPEERAAPAGPQSFLAPVYKMLSAPSFRGLVANVDRLADDEREMLKASLQPIVELYARL